MSVETSLLFLFANYHFYLHFDRPSPFASIRNAWYTPYYSLLQILILSRAAPQVLASNTPSYSLRSSRPPPHRTMRDRVVGNGIRSISKLWPFSLIGLTSPWTT